MFIVVCAGGPHVLFNARAILCTGGRHHRASKAVAVPLNATLAKSVALAASERVMHRTPNYNVWVAKR